MFTESDISSPSFIDPNCSLETKHIAVSWTIWV